MMKKILLLTISFFIISCQPKEIELTKYSIETLMTNNRSSGGYFSKDATKLLYSSDKSGIFNVYEMDLNSNKETQITDSKLESYFAISYSPLTNEIIYGADSGGNENFHLFLIREGQSIDLTPGEATKASFFGWSQDEKEMYFLSNSRNPKFFDVYKMNLENLKTEMIFKNNEGYTYYPLSNNDKYLVLNLNPSREIDELYIYEFETKNKIEISNQEANFWGQGFDKDDQNYYYSTNHDSEFLYLMTYNIKSGKRSLVYKTNWDVTRSSFSKNDKYRVVTINQDAQNKLIVKRTEDDFTIDFKGVDNMNINSILFSDDEKIARISAGASNSPGDIYTYNMKSKELKQITSNLNPEINPTDLIQGEVIRYNSFDELEIPAILYKPKLASIKNKVPALVWVHGGPGGQSRIGYRPLIQYLVNHGYAILAVNNRGSSGYGKTFYELDDKNHGDKDLKDCIWGKYWLQKQDYIKSENVGIIGGSYGGYMTMAAMTFEPEVFSVGVNIYGVTNWIRTLRSIPAYWESSRKSLYKELGDPYSKDSIRLYEISPLFHAKNIKNPIMVLQGANDPRVLQIESDEIVKEARDSGVYVEYLLFDDEGHGFIKKENQIEGYKKILNFLNNYLNKV
ncbi:MAG: S9 family peptidase [Flavobacteriaceae bacterium]|nr:S9 family peptidase [Flavobacteriaceae bacterium]